jgi:3-hydroxyisobutyrate dehydrogenase-like beta-hydroxyacid dehydrogenase
MGRPIARRLRNAGWSVCGWNRSPLPAGLASGIPLCGSFEEAARADICLIIVTASGAVDEIVARLEAHLSRGQLVLDMSTSDPERSQANARRLAERGVGWVDAPVSGGPEGAAEGSLAVMAGGTEADFARVSPLLQAVGGNVVRVGGPGAGHTVKVINQLIVGLVIEAVAEGLTLAEKAGLDPRLVQGALKGGFADSKILQIHGTRMIERRYQPGGSVKTQINDLYLARRLAEQAQVSLPHLDSVITFYERLMARGDANLDHSALHKLLWTQGRD